MTSQVFHCCFGKSLPDDDFVCLLLLSNMKPRYSSARERTHTTTASFCMYDTNPIRPHSFKASTTASRLLQLTSNSNAYLACTVPPLPLLRPTSTNHPSTSTDPSSTVDADVLSRLIHRLPPTLSVPPRHKASFIAVTSVILPTSLGV